MRTPIRGAALAIAVVTNVAAAAPQPVQDRLQAAIDDTVLGAWTHVSDDGRAWTATAGSSVAGRWRPVPAEGTYRIGSITKTFVAAVALQLVQEGRLGLDEPIRRYLPDALPGGYTQVTVRNLLQHTSGVPNYRPEVMNDAESALRDRWKQWRPQDLVAITTAHPPLAAPGTAMNYANANYVLLGMLIERVTGRWWGQEVRNRVIRPLGLAQIDVPAGPSFLPGRHAHGYVTTSGRLVDITAINMSAVDAVGSIVSTTADVDTFFGALHGGRLVRSALLKQMLTPFADPVGGVAGYGLGMMILRLPESCGGATVYGHGRGTFGFAGLALASHNGARRAVAAFNTTRFDEDASPVPKLLAIANAVFCG